MVLLECGGEGGIRTPGTRKRTIDFESTALDHSATSPKQIGKLWNVSCDVKILKRQKLQDLFLQSALSLQETVHEFKHCLTNSYANIRKNLNQVFTPLVCRIKNNYIRDFWVSKKLGKTRL